MHCRIISLAELLNIPPASAAAAPSGSRLHLTTRIFLPGRWLCHRLRPNLSCHFPFAAGAGAASPAVSGTGTSSTVSCTVATVLSPPSGICDREDGSPDEGDRRMSALEVFF